MIPDFEVLKFKVQVELQCFEVFFLSCFLCIIQIVETFSGQFHSLQCSLQIGQRAKRVYRSTFQMSDPFEACPFLQSFTFNGQNNGCLVLISTNGCWKLGEVVRIHGGMTKSLLLWSEIAAPCNYSVRSEKLSLKGTTGGLKSSITPCSYDSIINSLPLSVKQEFR